MKPRAHNGGPNPLADNPDASVFVMLRGPAFWGKFPHLARVLRWSHRDDPGDVIRFVEAP